MLTFLKKYSVAASFKRALYLASYCYWCTWCCNILPLHGSGWLHQQHGGDHHRDHHSPPLWGVLPHHHPLQHQPDQAVLVQGEQCNLIPWLPSTAQSVGVSNSTEVRLLLQTFYSGMSRNLTDTELRTIENIATRCQDNHFLYCT